MALRGWAARKRPIGGTIVKKEGPKRVLRKAVLTSVLAVVAILTMSGAALGSGFDAKLNVFLGLTLSGADEDLGAEVYYYHEWEETPPEEGDDGIWSYLDEYGWDTVPIVLHPTIGGTPWQLSLGYTVGETRFAVSWLGVQGQASASGSVPGEYREEYDEEGYAEEWSIGFVDFWDMGLQVYADRGFPGWYEDWEVWDYTTDGGGYEYTESWDPEAGASNWSASQELGLGSMYITAQHPVVRGNPIKVDVIGGLHRTTWQEKLDQHLGMVFHESDTETELYDERTYEYNWTYHNDVSIDTSSSVSYQAIGPAVGVAADWRVTDRFGVSVSAVGSYLAGTATFSGSGTDVDDITDTWTEWEDGEVTDQGGYRDVYEGEVSLAETAKALNTLAAEVEVGLKLDVTDSIFVEGGLFYALWKGLPMAPRWHYPYYVDGEGDGSVPDDQWTLDHTSDISLSGWTVGIGVRF